MKFEDSRHEQVNKRQEQIYKLLEQNGAMGVNALSRELCESVSTVQKHLMAQKFFRQNSKRWWDLPDRIVSENKTVTVQNSVQTVESSVHLIKAQLEELTAHTSGALAAISAVKRDFAVIQSAPPVAESGKIHSGLIQLNENIGKIPMIIRTRQEVVAKDLLQLLLNTNWMELILDNGRKYYREVIETDLYNVLLGEKYELNEEALTVIKEYQTDKSA